MIFAALMQDYQFYGLVLNDKLFVSLIFFFLLSPLLILRTASPRWGERALLSFLLVSSCDDCLLLSAWHTLEEAEELSRSNWPVAGLSVGNCLDYWLVRRPSPLWVEASLRGLYKKARGWWATVWNRKPHAYTLQSSVCVWLPALTSPDDQLMTGEMNWSIFYLCPGIFGPVVYQSKGHAVFSPSLLCWWKAHLFVSKAKHSSPVCFSVLWKPWLSLSSLTTLHTLVAPSSYT